MTDMPTLSKTAKHIATLAVFVDEADNQRSSATYQLDETNYAIVMRPHFVGQEDHLEEKFPWEAFAHELGHFLARVAGINKSRWPKLYSATANEVQAWGLAHKIAPGMPSDIEGAAIAQRGGQ